MGISNSLCIAFDKPFRSVPMMAKTGVLSNVRNLGFKSLATFTIL